MKQHANRNLLCREDAVGNIFGRWEGQRSEAVLTGSHCDAIPLAGKLSMRPTFLLCVICCQSCRVHILHCSTAD